jgi:phosphoglycerate dehydrogenase-like enzyme
MSSDIEVLVLSSRGLDSLPEEARATLDASCRLRGLALDAPPTPAEAAKLLEKVQVLAATNRCVPLLDERLLDAAPQLRQVVQYSTGTDHIDRELFTGRGITLRTLPSYATIPVSETALALVLAMATRLHLAHDRSRGLADPKVSLRGVELAGRTLGVVGFGRIGQRVGDLAEAIGMNVVAHDLRHAQGGGASHSDNGTRLLPLDRLLDESDVVVVCASRRYGDAVLLGADESARMRPGSFLANVSRPELVDTQAVFAALRSHRLRGYGIDETVGDPVKDADLLNEGRLVQTGHSAWWRDETLERGAQSWAEEIMLAVADISSAQLTSSAELVGAGD